MLTADLVRVRKKGSELTVTELGSKVRPRALTLASSFFRWPRQPSGRRGPTSTRPSRRLRSPPASTSWRSGCASSWRTTSSSRWLRDLEPRTLRSELFALAAQERKLLSDSEPWDREAFLAREAGARDLTPDALLRTLYADLRAAQVILAVRSLSAEQLVDGYDLAQKQAVLLRAVDLIADVRCADAYAYRELFRKLKFFRLLHRIEARVDGGYRIFIDGPFSLFTASTKYGLSLALSLPALLACDEHTITAALRWGKERTPLSFKLEGKSRRAREREEPRLPDEVEAFLSRFRALESGWDASISSDILRLPGEGLCVPDLRFVARATGEVAYLEVLGYWSRDAVWKRVELVSRGLSERVLFAVSSRLRVSEEVLGDDVPGSLYVYKGTLSPKEVLRRLDSQPELAVHASKGIVGP